MRALMTIVPAILLGLLALASHAQQRGPSDPRAQSWYRYVKGQSLPWDHPKYKGYDEAARDSAAPDAVTRTPQKYTLSKAALPENHAADDPNAALIVAHVPEDAVIWFDGAPTRQQGTVRVFQSEALKPDHEYNYKVRVVWYEDGRWVNQMAVLPVKAGGIQCLDVIPHDAETVEKEVKASLAKLAPEDRKQAEGQRFCAVQQGIRLGAMGVPVKVTVKGQPVFLCCAACEGSAKKNPDQTLEAVKKLKAK